MLARHFRAARLSHVLRFSSLGDPQPTPSPSRRRRDDPSSSPASSTPPTSDPRPLAFAVVGSGPSGFYTAQRLVRALPNARVDVFERLPVPFGLVRFGVAPDHQETKAVQGQFDAMLDGPNVRFVGNVEVGRDVTAQELQMHYTAVVFAYGSNVKSTLGIPGEQLCGVHSAGEMVGWYNGHPDHAMHNFDLGSVSSAAVIGMGNVALDIARVLLKGADGLRREDVPSSVLDQLAASRVREVHVIGRRGPVEAAFTNPELREIVQHADWDTYLEPSDVFLSPGDSKERVLARRLELLGLAKRGPPSAAGRKTFVFHFLRSPVEIHAKADDPSRTGSLTCVHNRLEASADGSTKAVATGTLSRLSTELIVKSIGYVSHAIPGVPFDAARKIIPNELGRVVSSQGIVSGLYACGWIKRGPTGIIATNLWDATQTVDVIVDDVKSGRVAVRLEGPSAGWAAVSDLLRHRGVRVVDRNGWRRIRAHEAAEGERVGKVREKIVDVGLMLDIAGA